jgi:dTDP-4-dehydrorhamnose 3,5-epimerase
VTSSAATTLASMKVNTTTLPGLLVLEPRVFRDAIGFFLESFNEDAMAGAGIRDRFVQDNHSYSAGNVLRGMHYQIGHPQGKLVRVVAGEIFDVAIDLRRSSPTFGKWEGVTLSGENFLMLWIPAGMAHGFRVLSDTAHVLYKATDFYHPECERTLAWDDPDVNINWKVDAPPIVSDKDAKGANLRSAEAFA